jgi:hypothetical protein
MAWQAVNGWPGSGRAGPVRKPDCSIQVSHSRAVSHLSQPVGHPGSSGHTRLRAGKT